MNSNLVRIKEVGRVTQVKKNIAVVQGLTNFMSGQLLTLENGSKALVMGFSRDKIQVLILDDGLDVAVGQEVVNNSEKFFLPVNSNIIGKVVNAYAQEVGSNNLAVNLDEPDTQMRDVFNDAAQVLDRQVANAPFLTGNKIIDAVLPLSKGQRQLLIGDRMTGKTSVALDALLNQKDKNVICIYCCIGKSFSAIKKIIEILESHKAFNYTAVVAAGASSAISQQFLAPYCAAAIGEYFMYRGKDVFVVFDDLNKHAWAYRQLSLLLERVPGRQAYPGDIFYIHSQLMERAGKLSQKLNAGSMTFMPIIETTQGNIADFISSNLISITDGQVYFSPVLFNEGMKPAIDILLSVSRLGNKNQNPILKSLASSIRYEYAQYRELLKLTRLRTDLSTDVQEKLNRGSILVELFMQQRNHPVCWQELTVLLYVFSKNIFKDMNDGIVKKIKARFFSFILENDGSLMLELEKTTRLTPDIELRLNNLLMSFLKK